MKRTRRIAALLCEKKLRATGRPQEMHVPCTGFPQAGQNRGGMRRLTGAFLTMIALGVLAEARQQAIDADAIFRVYLKSGQALPAYGESALVGDRVVFTLLLGAAPTATSLQLMSLPAANVDLDRTRRYANTIRAKHYAATRGELDYAAMSQEVQRTLGQLPAVQDPKKRLEMALEAKKRLMTWAEGTYGYRAADVRVLTNLFDEVINELRAAAGEKQFSLDLRVGQSDFEPEPLLRPPTLRECIELALAAAMATDTADDRLSVLNAVIAAAGDDPAVADLRARVTRELGDESRTTAAYESLVNEVRTQADAARRKGDAAGIEAAIATLGARDLELGGRKPPTVTALATELNAMLEATRTYRAKVDRYLLMRGSLLAYERRVRPTMSGFDGLLPVLASLRDTRYTSYERLERASAKLATLQASLAGVEPPEDLVDVHASLASAMQMADHAVARRKRGISTANTSYDTEASTAAAGALMLAQLAREQLVVRLYPPKIQ